MKIKLLFIMLAAFFIVNQIASCLSKQTSEKKWFQIHTPFKFEIGFSEQKMVMRIETE